MRRCFKNLVHTAIKNCAFRMNVRRIPFFELYQYMFEPHQLICLCEAISNVKGCEGKFVEVGCAYGRTTAFLNRYIDHLGIDPEYVVIDTFSGFVPDQADSEIENIGVSKSIRNMFKDNRIEWVERGLRNAGIKRVTLVKKDATKFDYASLGKIAFCLIDIDLYDPIARILPDIYENLSAGGIIIIDNCDNYWGAHRAYLEFVNARGFPEKILTGKLGFVSK